jgi:prepilin-type N-terminal cleavage/methylation domain-containing protein
MNYLNTTKHQNYKSGAGFTLVELIVVIAIITVLYGIILFSVTRYVNKGKDSSIAGNLAVLVPAGEVYYNTENATNGDGYHGFCSSSVATNAFSQMPANTIYHCTEDPANNHQAWAACAGEFTNQNMAFCVDSRGVKEEMKTTSCPCTGSLIQCPDLTLCP